MYCLLLALTLRYIQYSLFASSGHVIADKIFTVGWGWEGLLIKCLVFVLPQ